jgi:NAD(P)-dependent dehydrogenase (short-subunit alcohol dehydrogenase family)
MLSAAWGKLDCLVNGAGGNKPQATTRRELKFFDLPADALRWVFELNILGTILPSQAFGKIMARTGLRHHPEHFVNELLPAAHAHPGVLGGQGRGEQLYAVAGRAHGAGILAEDSRERNRAGILPHQSESLSAARQGDGRADRARQIDHRHTPMARFGEPEDLFGAVLWLLSPASEFVTGVVVPDRRRILGVQRRVSRVYAAIIRKLRESRGVEFSSELWCARRDSNSRPTDS